jgi:hypothetical protein
VRQPKAISGMKEQNVDDKVMQAIMTAIRKRVRKRAAEAEKEIWNDDGARRRVRRRDRPRCGAMTRGGTPCQAPCVWDREKDAPRNGKCKLHGGLSSGPTTKEGRQRAIEAMQQGHRRWRDRRKATLQNVT